MCPSCPWAPAATRWPGPIGGYARWYFRYHPPGDPGTPTRAAASRPHRPRRHPPRQPIPGLMRSEDRKMQVLVVNAGSSSLKLRLLDAHDQTIESADLPAQNPGIDHLDLTSTLRDWPAPDAAGHRVVHGGTRFTGPVLVDGTVENALRQLTDLAPLHQPKSLAAF